MGEQRKVRVRRVTRGDLTDRKVAIYAEHPYLLDWVSPCPNGEDCDGMCAEAYVRAEFGDRGVQAWRELQEVNWLLDADEDANRMARARKVREIKRGGW